MQPSPAIDIGPQHRQDDPFTARMRFHQSWYRARVLKVPYGSGPNLSNKTYYGNMLTLPDGERGLNFIVPHIFEVAKRRLAEGKGLLDRFRLLCNLLSSQPMCFNLFGLLVDDTSLATNLLQAAFPGEIDRVTRVLLEYAPQPVSVYLNDRTAFDEFVEYTRPDGALGFVGIETKLSEPLSTRPYSQPEYWKWTRRSNSPWPESAWPALVKPDVNHFWRGHLLVEAMLHQPDARYQAGRFAVIYHPEDDEGSKSIRSYRELLKPGDMTFAALPLDDLVSRWIAAAPREAIRDWLSGFNLRYLDLAQSEEEWEKYIGSQQKK